MDKALAEIVSKLPKKITQMFSTVSGENLQEIRFRVGQPSMLYYSDRKSYLGKNGECSQGDAFVFENSDIEEVVANFCQHSVYAYSENIKDGFITLSGGHRVGIGGRAVANKDGISNLTEFSSVNIRIAREYKDSAKEIVAVLMEKERIYNTIIIAPPGAGKTTILRDIARRMSQNYKVTIIDERFEIAAQRLGASQFDIGLETDVLSGFSKSDGITHALRSLSPDVIICDEIGSRDDVISLENILKGGCKIITTMHGYSIKEAKEKKCELMSLFEMAVLLHKENGKPEVAKCIKLWE